MTFTFEDALISPIGLSILLGANLTSTSNYYHHVTIKSRAIAGDQVKLDVTQDITDLAGAEAKLVDPAAIGATDADKEAKIFVYATDESGSDLMDLISNVTVADNVLTSESFVAGKYYIIDAYIKVGGTTMSITPDKFSDYFYIEAETLFRREVDGVDKPAQFVIPKGKVTSEFNIAMANSGDPSTFTFTVDAMSDYIKFDKTKKVLCAINVLD